MVVILGLILLIAAVVVIVAGVLTNGGHAHVLTHGFSVLGYHVTGSTGTLFLYGVVAGAVVLFGLSLLLVAARRTSRRGSAPRVGLERSRRKTAAVSKERDDLIVQRETARADVASVRTSETTPGAGHPNLGDGRRSWLHPFGHRAPGQPAAAAPNGRYGAHHRAEDTESLTYGK